ncbi:acyl-protein synthetase [Robertmurraya sp. DFI.2.37]|uniref:LuxE/PaaK family acyltransferase n=1 Tax=Robertmurraya sp. DFI.2.37 TaxID=3031819 RepID=UPI0012457C83|nr:acyl-protein synthetase [Robertmurraya sp. DFI.2.37]MDF1507846.1 acyl-protein synthetase [Robertmurraya sp. DFI.2.37]
MTKSADKQNYLLAELNELTKFHYSHCEPYKQMLSKSNHALEVTTLEEIPFLPVQLFKMLALHSIAENDIFKVLTSSGTTGQQVSKIYLDKDTAKAQTKALVEVMTPLLGKKRLPMIMIDTKNVLKDRKSFSARGAGILGFSNFGRRHFYLLHDDMTIDWDGLNEFLEQHKDERVLLFGFTFMIWQYFYQATLSKGIKLNLKDSVLIHGGGWKKLKDQSVSNERFKDMLFQQFGIQSIHNYYGMVEQVGSIFVECPKGHLHTPVYADVIIRDPLSFQPLPFGEQGLIQVLSTLPKSYPGHSLLTEDLGTIHGEDDCSCGWKGKYFSVAGRIPKAELRGCSDTFAFDKKVGKTI